MNNMHEINVQFQRSYELILSMFYLPQLLNRAGQSLVLNLIFSTLLHCNTYGTQSSNKIFKQQSFPTVRQTASTLAYPPSDKHTHTHSDFEIFVYTELNLEHLYSLTLSSLSGSIIWHRELNLQNDDTYTSLGSVRPMRHRSKCVRSAEVPDTYIVLKMCFSISFLIILENVLLLSSNVVGIGYLAS
jgi:hypothetical protein